jgi:phage/plasmid-like protein (TIGR03299 family)
MFSGNNVVPWHKLGQVVAGLLTSKEAIQAAHLDWQVVSRPLSVDGVQLPFPDDESSDGYQATVRADNGAVLGVVKGRYEIIQNSEAFSFFDAVTQTGEAVYETAGALRGGKVVWIMATLPGSLFINGDEHKKMILLCTSHDGSCALRMRVVTVRVVCNNTLSIALKGQAAEIKIRHTTGYKDKVEEARRCLGIADKYFETLTAAVGGMNDRLMSSAEMEQFTAALYPSKEDKVSGRTANIRAEVNRLFAEGAGNTGKSRWDALQAVTDYVDHFAPERGSSSRFESGTLGSGAQVKQKAFEMLTSEDVMAGLLERAHKAAATATGHSDDFERLLSI